MLVVLFDGDDEALALANDSPFGLAASVWTRAVFRAQRFTRELPHGGCGASGFGKDMSVYSFEEYTHVKHVMSDVTGRQRKDWHRTVFTGSQEEPR